MLSQWFFTVRWNCGGNGIRLHYFIGMLLKKLEGIRKKIFEGEVSRFFSLQRYKIRVCLLPVLYHIYTNSI